MKKLFATWLGLIIASFLLTACSGGPFDPSSAYKGQTAVQLYQNGLKQLKQGYYQDASQYFRTLDARYPYSQYTANAQLDMIYTYYMNGDDPSAMVAADRFIHLHPADPHVDYAYYMRALVNFDSSIGSLERHLPVDFSRRDLVAAKKSFVEYAELVHRFPNSAYVPDALKRMTYLRNLLALHQFEVAKFYMKHKAYLAAAARAQNIVLHYQQASVMPEALQLLHKAYLKLGLSKKAETVAAIYTLNYPTQK